jgi:hypothetical protein
MMVVEKETVFPDCGVAIYSGRRVKLWWCQKTTIHREGSSDIGYSGSSILPKSDLVLQVKPGLCNLG